MREQTDSSRWTRTPVVVLTAFICCTLWGSASSAIKIGYELFQVEDTPARILFAGCRFALAGGMVIAFESLQQKHFLKLKKSSFKYAAVLSLFQTILQYVFFYMGLAHTSGVRASVMNAAGTFFSIFLAVYVFHFEKMTGKMLLGSITGFAGVVLVITNGSLSSLKGSFTFEGEGAMLCAAFASALAGNFIKLFSRKEDPVALSGYQFLMGGTIMILIGFLTGGRLHITGAGAVPLLFYMAFISAGAYSLWGILLKYNPVSTVSVLGFINPVMGVLLSALFLHENNDLFQWSLLAALLLVCLGIIIVNKPDQKKAVSRFQK